MHEFKPQTLQQIVDSLESDIVKLYDREDFNTECLLAAKYKEAQVENLNRAIRYIERSAIETDLTQVALVLRSTIKRGSE